MLRKKRRSPVYSTDHDGKAIVLVSLANHPEPAKLLKADFLRLEAMGLGMAWTFNSAGNGYRYVRASVPSVRGRLLTVARLIAGACGGQCVQYRDGNRLNLRSDNLFVSEGYAKCRAEIPVNDPF